jgi:hypothetical protein
MTKSPIRSQRKSRSKEKGGNSKSLLAKEIKNFEKASGYWDASRQSTPRKCSRVSQKSCDENYLTVEKCMTQDIAVSTNNTDNLKEILIAPSKPKGQQF